MEDNKLTEFEKKVIKAIVDAKDVGGDFYPLEFIETLRQIMPPTKKELEDLQDALFWNTSRVDELTDESPININIIFDIDGYRAINRAIQASRQRNKEKTT
jgi:hypothetical protein